MVQCRCQNRWCHLCRLTRWYLAVSAEVKTLGYVPISNEGHRGRQGVVVDQVFQGQPARLEGGGGEKTPLFFGHLRARHEPEA